MEPPLALFALADCHDSILQRIINVSAREDLGLLRGVARRFRDAVRPRVTRLRPTELPADLPARFPGLVSLDLQRCTTESVTAWLGPTLAQLPHLRELLNLRLSDADEHAEWLPALQALTRLSLRDVRAEGACLAVAAHCRSLERLSFHTGHLTCETLHAMVAQLAGSLTELDMRQVHLYDDGPQPLGLLPLNTGRLRTLCLPFSSPAGLEELSQLANFTSLSRLHLSCPASAYEGIEELNALTQLTALALYARMSCSVSIARLTRLTRVSDLAVNGSCPADLGPALAGFPGLTSLEVGEHLLLLFGDALRALPGLTRLVADNSRLLAQPEALEGLSQLKELSLRHCSLQITELERLPDLPQLTRLDLSEPTATIALSDCGHWLTQLTALQQLSLSGWRHISSRALDQLAQMQALRALDVSVEHWLPTLVPLDRLRLRLLWLPQQYQSSQQVPLGLRAAFEKGCRCRFLWLGREDERFVSGAALAGFG